MEDSSVTALEQAKALFNATAEEADGKRREALADRIGELLKRHDTADIAFRRVMALNNARTRSSFFGFRRLRLALRFTSALMDGVSRASALADGTGRDPDPRQREVTANRIGNLVEGSELRLIPKHLAVDLACSQAIAFANATEGEQDPRQREAMADRIGDLRKRCDSKVMALVHVGALANAIGDGLDPCQCATLVDRIRAILKDHNLPVIRLAQTRPLKTIMSDGEARAAWAKRIEALASGQSHEG